MSKVDLSLTNLAGADLREANLGEAYLGEANLLGAINLPFSQAEAKARGALI